MRATRRFLPLLLLLGLGCAHGRNPGPSDPPIPFLTRLQILGLQRPSNLVRDPASGQWLQPEVLSAYQALQADAARDGWKLTIVSGYRSFAMQRSIWNRKMRALEKEGTSDPDVLVDRVMRYTSIPGISRHHWGTDVDLGEATIEPKVAVTVQGHPRRMQRFYDWLDLHGPPRGFCKAYRGGSGAIQDEPWHWSYTRLAASYSRRFQAIRDFEEIHGQEVDGWKWIHAHFQEIKKLQSESVNPECDGEAEAFSGPPRGPMPKPPPSLDPPGDDGPH